MIGRFTRPWKIAAEQRRLDVARTPYFFFYGSLMERYENFNRHIKKRVLSVEIAYCQGYLYHLPVGFPGLIVPEEPCEDLVAGEVMTFNEPERVMKILDRLEDYYPSRPERSVYQRQILPVIMEIPGPSPSFRQISAWVYSYPEDHLSISHQRQVRIECGQWKAFAKRPRNSATPDLLQLVKRQRFSGRGEHIAIEPALQKEPLILDNLGPLPCYHFCRNQHLCGQHQAKKPDHLSDAPDTSLESEPLAQPAR